VHFDFQVDDDTWNLQEPDSYRCTFFLELCLNFRIVFLQHGEPTVEDEDDEDESDEDDDDYDDKDDEGENC
jgi:hypothetical protein